MSVSVIEHTVANTNTAVRDGRIGCKTMAFLYPDWAILKGLQVFIDISIKNTLFSYFINVLSEKMKRDVCLDRSWQNSLYMDVVLSQLQPCSIKVALPKW